MTTHRDTSDTNNDPVSGGGRRRTVPMLQARGPFEYTPGDQENNVQLTTVAEMLQWAQN